MYTEEMKKQRKICSAILASRNKQPYKKYIKEAETKVCTDIQDNSLREKIIMAIELNLSNYKSHPFEALRRKYDLPMTAGDFRKEKKKFCDVLLGQSGLGIDDMPRAIWTKEDVLNMLYSIADEANEYIVKEDGAFNHQVAGVALKAIDQAVKLTGMYEKETVENSYIELDGASDYLGT